MVRFYGSIFSEGINANIAMQGVEQKNGENTQTTVSSSTNMGRDKAEQLEEEAGSRVHLRSTETYLCL